MFICRTWKCLAFLAPKPVSITDGSHENRDHVGGDNEPKDWDEFSDWSEDDDRFEKQRKSAASSSSNRDVTRRGTNGAQETPEIKPLSQRPKQPDIFSDLGMEPEYRRPKVAPKAAAKVAPAVASLLADDSLNAAWGDEGDLDLGLDLDD
eukprot:GEMP01040754.1.p1 GENE.GEMP01040754.1~~GEMP01040754.1.p1  ORF type:complete len:150 (+),score=22.90 GEMP01040754.1:144-593(+)